MKRVHAQTGIEAANLTPGEVVALSVRSVDTGASEGRCPTQGALHERRLPTAVETDTHANQNQALRLPGHQPVCVSLIRNGEATVFVLFEAIGVGGQRSEQVQVLGGQDRRA